MPMLTTDKQRKMTSNVERTIHRIRGMMLWLDEHMNANEAAADEAGWGEFQSLADLERDLAEYIARNAFGDVYRESEQAARDKILSSVDPEGEAYFNAIDTAEYRGADYGNE